MKKRLTPRSLVSLAIAACFLAISVTGLLLYLLKHSRTTAAIHTSFGLLFLVVATFHVRNNWKSLKGYSYQPDARGPAFLRRELYLTVLPAGLLLAGLMYEVPGLWAAYDWGNEWRARQENKEESRATVQFLKTNPQGRGVALELYARKGKAFEYPLFAVWIEDTDGHYIETLYVSNVIATSRYVFGREEENGEWVPDVVRRPEALPCWGHQRGIQAKDGYYLPDPDNPVPDVVSGATPTESFLLSTRADRPLTVFRILLEVNQSFDWNDYYSKDRFPEDKIYSGPGKNGQPSVIYAATIDLSRAIAYHALNPVGHGHPGGQDGKLDPDLSGLTTALDIVDGVMVKVIR